MAIGEVQESIGWPLPVSQPILGTSTLDTAITVEDYSRIPEWDAFVLQHPKGSIFHSSAMQRCELHSKNRVPFAIGALDSEGRLCAALAAVKVDTFDWVSTQFSSRSILYAEPIHLNSDDGHLGVSKLIETHDEFMQNKVLFSEVRPFYPPDENGFDPLSVCGYHRLGYRNYELRMNADEAEIFQRLDTKRRNNVRSAIRKGVTVREIEFRSGIDTLYELLKASHSHSKTPLVHKSFLDAAGENLPIDSRRILIAYYQGEPLAGGCFLSYKNRVICWFAGTKRIPGIAGTTLVFWEAIRLHSSLGFEIFDLAGGGWEGEEYGPGKFKSKFGGELIHCDRYRKVYSPLKMRLAEAAFARLRKWIAPSTSQDNSRRG